MSPEELYLALLKQCLTRLAFEEPYASLLAPRRRVAAKVLAAVQTRLTRHGLEIVRRSPPRTGRVEGRDAPAQAETMIGLHRLDNIQFCVTEVIRRSVPGDLIETGVWRGGATIFMRAVLKAYDDTTRAVWVADSFRGLPPPSGKYQADSGDLHWTRPELAVSVDDVRANFARYGLLDDQVKFLEGLFQDTLPSAPIDQLAVVRLDGDMYESTIVALEELYPKLSPGGFLIVDDYGALKGCRQAVDDYRRDHGISEPLVEVDWTGVFWQRGAPS
jgi:O-methyltransferase